MIGAPWQRALGFGVVLSLMVTCALPAVIDAHPLHTTITQLTLVPSDRAAQLMVRMSAEDFAVAVAKRTNTQPARDHRVAEAGALAYAQASVRLLGRDGRPRTLRLCGMEWKDATLLLCLRADAPDGVSQMQLSNVMMFELFEDQVNVVQAAYGPQRRTILFVRGGAAQRLP